MCLPTPARLAMRQEIAAINSVSSACSIHWREYGLHERFAGIDICSGFNPIREDDIEEGWAREVQVFGKLCKPVVMVRTL